MSSVLDSLHDFFTTPHYMGVDASDGLDDAERELLLQHMRNSLDSQHAQWRGEAPKGTPYVGENQRYYTPDWANIGGTAAGVAGLGGIGTALAHNFLKKQRTTKKASSVLDSIHAMTSAPHSMAGLDTNAMFGNRGHSENNEDVYRRLNPKAIASIVAPLAAIGAGTVLMQARKGHQIKKGSNMSLLDEIRNEASTTTRRKFASNRGLDLSAIITKVAEDEDDEGSEAEGGGGGANDEPGGNENGEIPGLGEGGHDEPNEGVQLPPELQHLLMILMQHPEILQQLMQGGGIPDDAMGQAMGGPEGGMPGGEEGGMPPEMAGMAAGGGGAPGGGGMPGM